MSNPNNLVRPAVLNAHTPNPSPQPTASSSGSFNMDQLTNIVTGLVSNILRQEGRNMVQAALNPNANFSNISDVTIDQSLSNNITELDKIPDVVRCLREFSGNPGEYNSWKKSVDRILQIYEPLKGTPKYYGILNVVRNKVVGNADIALESYNTPLDWKAISLRYADKRDIGTLEYQMTSLAQGNLTIQEFYQRVYSHLSLILNKLGCMDVSAESMHLLTQTYRDKALDTFIRGLKGDLPRLLGMREPVDLPQALHLCLKLENQNFRSHYALSQNRKTHDFRPPLPPRKTVNDFYPQLAYMPRPQMQPQNFANQYRPQAPFNNYRNFQQYRPLGQQAPAKPQLPRPEPMDVDKTLHSRAINYMNRPVANNGVKRPSNFSQQIPLKQQRNFHIETGAQHNYQQEYPQDPQYDTDKHYQQDWTPTEQEYETALTSEENGQPAQEYGEGNPQSEMQDYIDIHFLE